MGCRVFMAEEDEGALCQLHDKSGWTVGRTEGKAGSCVEGAWIAVVAV